MKERVPQCPHRLCFMNSPILGISHFLMSTSEFDLLLVQCNDVNMCLSKTCSNQIRPKPCPHASLYRAEAQLTLNTVITTFQAAANQMKQHGRCTREESVIDYPLLDSSRVKLKYKFAQSHSAPGLFLRSCRASCVNVMGSCVLTLWDVMKLKFQ